MPRLNFHDEVTPAQARVLYHIERVFRSTGTHFRAYAAFLDRAEAIVPGRRTLAGTWTPDECALLHHAVVAAARTFKLHFFRSVAP
jgi:hypothetical protein